MRFLDGLASIALIALAGCPDSDSRTAEARVRAGFDDGDLGWAYVAIPPVPSRLAIASPRRAGR